MEDQQNTPNPQAQMQQAQVQFALDVVKTAGLDANNPDHLKMASEVLKNINDLQAPEREKELNGVMREYGVQPDEFRKAMTDYDQKIGQFEKQLQVVDGKEQDLLAKSSARTRNSGIFGVAIGIISAVISRKKWSWVKDKGRVAKVFAQGGIFFAAAAATGVVLSYFLTKPLQKENAALESQKEQAVEQGTKLVAQKVEMETNVFRDLAANMLKTRAEAAAKPAPAPVVEAPKPAPAAPEKKNFVEKTIDKVKETVTDVVKSPVDKILDKKPEASKAEAVVASKEAAAQVHNSL